MNQEKRITKIDSMRVFKFLLRENFKQRLLIIAVILMPISAFALGTSLPYLMSTLLARLAQNELQGFATTSIILIVTSMIVGIVANRLAFMMLMRSQANTLERLQNEIFDSLLQKDRAYFANRMTGKLTSDVLSLQPAMLQFQDLLAINALPFITNIVFGIGLVAWQAPLLGLGLLIMTLVVIATAIYYSNKRAPLRVRRHAIRRDLFGYFADVVTNNSAVKIFSSEKQEKAVHAKLNKRFADARLEDWTQMAKDGNNRIIGILAMQLIFIIAVINAVQSNPGLLATGIFAFSFTLTLTNKLFEISSILKGLESVITEASSVVEILDNQPTIVDKQYAKELKVGRGEIQFSNVSFHYEENQKSATLFKDLSFKVNPSTKVGLVGRSGGGKTTITNLLLRFNDIDSGQILIDGQNITTVTQRSLRQSISYVPQEPLLFHRTLAENIAYGRPDATQKEIEAVAKMAHAHDFIKDLPDGYKTLVGERGVKLSGGQRQRVAIARAMLKNAPILVLDEATSALDSESEVLIQDALWKLMEGKTAIVIAHRLSTIQKMDRIMVMDKGKILEQGTHNELIRKDGIYAELWSHQSGGFMED